MKTTSIAAALSLGVLLTMPGCSRRKEITELNRKEAAHLMAEAEFALTLRDWPRAESLLAKAAELTPDVGAYWIDLGAVRRRMGNRNGAQSAYKGALVAFEQEAGKDPKDADAWLQQAYVLALLGRVEDARKLVDKAARRFPENPQVRSFVERKKLDALLADPQFKEMAL